MLVESYSIAGSTLPAGCRQAADADRTLVLAFGAAELADDPHAFAPLGRAFPDSVVLGCSTAGEIAGGRLRDGSISVGVARFAHTTMRTAYAEVGGAEGSSAAGQAIARARAHPSLGAVFVLSDGLRVNGSALVDGLSRSLPPGVVVTGGLAADGDRFKRTWVLHQGRPTHGLVAAVGFYGPRFRCGHGSKGGWDLFGPARVVTRARGNVLYELDGRPALELYKSYLGDRAAGLPATALLFPLAVRTRGAHATEVVRTVLAVDEATQSMTFAGDIPEGAEAQLMRASFDRLIAGASAAARSSRDAAADRGPVLAVAVSCVGRRLVLGERAEEEIEATLGALPDGAHQVGFYSYGEISSREDGRAGLQNQTMTLTTLGEA